MTAGQSGARAGCLRFPALCGMTGSAFDLPGYDFFEQSVLTWRSIPQAKGCCQVNEKHQPIDP
jgi:hypothetical protein